MQVRVGQKKIQGNHEKGQIKGLPFGLGQVKIFW